jgi:hypothetical protein
MDKRTVSIIYFGFIGLVTIFMVFTVYYVIHFKEVFTSNPLIYGVSKMPNVDCICRQWDNGQRFVVAQFWFNGSEMKKMEPLFSYRNSIDLNISIVNVTT